MTLTGKRGTLVARNEIGFDDISDGWAVLTGTWKVIRGTGVYAGSPGADAESARSWPMAPRRPNSKAFSAGELPPWQETNQSKNEEER